MILKLEPELESGLELELKLIELERYLNLEYIIEELPKINRYIDISDIFYSAAQHAYEICEILPTIELKKAALLHNVPNIFLNKNNLHRYVFKNKDVKELEERIIKTLFKKFNIEYVTLKRISVFDSRLTVDELNSFNLKTPNELKSYKSLGVFIYPLTISQSREVYKSYIKRYFKY